MPDRVFDPFKLRSESDQTWVDPTSGWFLADRDGGFLFLNPGTLEEYQLEGTFAGAVRDFLQGGESWAESPLRKLESVLPSERKGLLHVLKTKEFLRSPSVKDVLSLDSPQQLWIEVQGSCNEECRHCYAESAPKDLPSLDPDTVESIVKDASTMGFDLVQFTGGDPLLWEELPGMVRLTRDREMIPEIYTNGLLLDESLYSALEPARPRYAFSLYSHEPEVHDSITQHPGSWDRTLEALDRALDGSTSVRVGVIIMEQNRGQEEEIVDFLTERGVDPDRINLAYTQDVGRGSSIPNLNQPSSNDGSPRSEPSPPSGEDVGDSGHLSGARRGFNPGKLCVSYRGDVIPCIFQRELSLGSIHRRSLSQIVDDPRVRFTAQSLGQNHEKPNDPNRLTCSECRFHAFLLRYFHTDG